MIKAGFLSASEPEVARIMYLDDDTV